MAVSLGNACKCVHFSVKVRQESLRDTYSHVPEDTQHAEDNQDVALCFLRRARERLMRPLSIHSSNDHP